MHENKEKTIGNLTMQIFSVTKGDKGISCAFKGVGEEGVSQAY